MLQTSSSQSRALKMGLVNKTFCRQEVRDCQFETLQIRSEFKKKFYRQETLKITKWDRSTNICRQENISLKS